MHLQYGAALPDYLSKREHLRLYTLTYLIMKHCRSQSSKPWNVEEMSYVGDLSTQPGRKHVKTIQSII
jgi:hypothetical protein